MDNESGEKKKRTVRDYVFGCVNFQISDETAECICDERGIDPDKTFDELFPKPTEDATDVVSEEENLEPKRTKELLKADLYVWICMGPTKVNSTSDSDNGWSHSEGGYQLTDEDKDRMLAYAKTIYDKYGEEFDYDDSVEVTVISFGIQPCDYNEAGIPLPHEVSL
jgi:hypothetical protein